MLKEQKKVLQILNSACCHCSFLNVVDKEFKYICRGWERSYSRDAWTPSIGKCTYARASLLKVYSIAIDPPWALFPWHPHPMFQIINHFKFETFWSSYKTVFTLGASADLGSSTRYLRWQNWWFWSLWRLNHFTLYSYKKMPWLFVDSMSYACKWI